MEQYSCHNEGMSIVTRISQGTATIIIYVTFDPFIIYSTVAWAVDLGKGDYKYWAWHHSPREAHN